MELHELSPNLAPFCRRTTQVSHAEFSCLIISGCTSIEPADLGVDYASGDILYILHCASADEADSSVHKPCSLILMLAL